MYVAKDEEQQTRRKIDPLSLRVFGIAFLQQINPVNQLPPL